MYVSTSKQSTEINYNYSAVTGAQGKQGMTGIKLVQPFATGGHTYVRIYMPACKNKCVILAKYLVATIV